MFIQREGPSIQLDWNKWIILPWNISKNSFQKTRQVCGGRLAIPERPLVSPQRRGGGRAAPRPLALSLQLVVRWQVIRADTGRDCRPSWSRVSGKSANDARDQIQGWRSLSRPWKMYSFTHRFRKIWICMQELDGPMTAPEKKWPGSRTLHKYVHKHVWGEMALLHLCWFMF